MATLKAAYFTVTYTMSPALGSDVFSGDAISVSGTIAAGAQATQIRSIGLNLIHSSGKFVELGYVDRTIAAGKTGSFSFNVAVGNDVLNLVPAGQNYAGVGLRIAVYDAVGGDGGYWDRSDAAQDSTFTSLYVHRYRIQPMITGAEFARVRNGVVDNEGTQVACRSLKINLDAGLSLSGLTVRTVTVTNAANAAEKYTVNIPDSALQAAVSANGYSESAPVILVGRTFSTSNSYRIELTVGNDRIRAMYTANIDRAFANMHLSGASTGGVAFGQFSTATEGKPKLESKYPAYFYGGIYGVTDFTLGEIATGGHWIDGKPIYRYVGSRTLDALGETFLTSAITSGSVDTLIGCGGSMVNGAWKIPVGFQTYSGTQYNFALYLSASGLLAHVGSGLTINSRVVYWVEYTKV